MSTDTEIIVKAPDKPEVRFQAESQLFGVSVRAWVVLMVIGTLCARELGRLAVALYTNSYVEDIKEPLYGVVYGIIGYYFGQAKNNGQQASTTFK